MSKRGLGFVGLLAALVLIAGACQQAQTPTEPTDTKQKGGTLNIEVTEPASLDPPLATTSEDYILTKHLFRGLVTYHPKTAKVLPGVATKWEPNADFTKWTFTLRKGTKFSNGEEVTAESFVRGWTRALTGDTFANGLGYHMLPIKGATELSEGKTTTLGGVKATDKYTLEVELVESHAEFFVRTGYVGPFAPVPSDAAIQAQKPSFGEFPIGNGPFKMKEAWAHNQQIVLVPNETYFGEKPFASEVVFKILTDPDAAFLEWEAGNIDWVRPPPGKLAEVKNDKQHYLFGTESTVGTDFLLATLEKKPTNERKFRQAISMAIDRQKISDAVFSGTKTPATSVIPPSVPGYRKAGPCKYCKLDPTAAKKALSESGVAPGAKVELWYNASGGHGPWIEAVAANLKENLGLNAVPVGRADSFGVYLKAVKALNEGAMVRFAWGMDYPTPDNFLFPLFGTGSSDNYNGYSSAEFDAKVKEARAQKDASARIKLYQEAEDILLEELPQIPIWYRTPPRLARVEKWGGLSIDFNEFPTYDTAYLKSKST